MSFIDSHCHLDMLNTSEHLEIYSRKQYISMGLQHCTNTYEF